MSMRRIKVDLEAYPDGKVALVFSDEGRELRRILFDSEYEARKSFALGTANATMDVNVDGVYISDNGSAFLNGSSVKEL